MLDPVVITDSFCRFTLLNKGILHSHSKITLALTKPDTNSRFYPINIGVAALIQRAALKVGTKTLQEIDGYNFLTAYKSMFVSNEHQAEREQVQSSKMINHDFRYSEDVDTRGGVDNDTRAFSYGLMNGKDYNSMTAVGDNTADPNGSVFDWADINNSPVFQIALSDLFPMLKSTQLPLYMMKEQVSIELTWEPTSTTEKGRLCSASGTAWASPSIDQNQVKFIADYIYYDQEIMDAYAAQNSVININHMDYRHSKVSVSATVAKSTQIRNLGGANRIVTKVITGIQASEANDSSLLNQYHAMCCEVNYARGQTSGSNGQQTMNIRYNDHFLFPIDVKNSARHFHNTAQSEGMVPFVTREEYSAEGTALTPDEFMGYVQDKGSSNTDATGLMGRFAWNGFRLNRNERINSRGIELFSQFQNLDEAGTYIQRSWIELVKLTQLIDGYVSTEFA
tara:strand:+ start:1 stop:1356 length:1356 start_codon:yes stop_codon:yes gene_type:complete